MPDRVAHDHPTVDTIDATIERHGGTTRPVVRVRKPLDVEPDSLVRLVLDGREYRSLFEKAADGSTVIKHAASSPAGARNPGTSENALIEWIDARDLDLGRSLHLDVVESGFRYGLRVPGDDAIYAVGRPDESLAAIAETLDAADSKTDS